MSENGFVTDYRDHPKLRGILERLAQARQLAGLTQAQAAAVVGWETGAAVSHIESGNRRLTMGLFLALCDAYGVNPAWALTGINPDFDPQPVIEMIGEHHADLGRILDTLSMISKQPGGAT